MRSRIFALAAALLCCFSCIENSYELGSDLVPTSQLYTFYNITVPLTEISMEWADSLSGYSTTRMTIGAVRDETFGLATRSCAISLVPMFSDSLVIGENPVFTSFHFAAAKDTISYSDPNQERILQTFTVYELTEAIDASVSYDCNRPLEQIGQRINTSTIIYSGDDSLSFNLSSDFGQRFLDEITSEDLEDMDTYLEKFPGIYICASEPSGNGGRINMFELQLTIDSDYYYITGNYATLNYSAEFDGERRDTSIYFYYGTDDFYDIDSLVQNVSSGSYPQYSLNLTSQETRSLEGKAGEKIYVEGGGGLKPKVAASELKSLVEEAVLSVGGNLNTAVVSKATLSFPFEFPDDYTEMDYCWPEVLSPTCRVIYDINSDDDSGYVTFMGITDSSNDDENQGDVNRSTLRYEPDITHHLQSILRIDLDDESASSTKYFNNGSYDIWLLIMANEVTTTTSSSSSDLSELYTYLAYQSYYNYMYGSGSYSNYYSNYYNYLLLASLYGSSSSTESVSLQLDRDRYYCATLCGPDYPDEDKTPKLIMTIGIPQEEYE